MCRYICRHVQWSSGITRSLKLFEDKLALLKRATEAEDALLARTLSEQEAMPTAHAQSNWHTTATHLDFTPTERARQHGIVEDSASLQRALSSSLQQQQSLEDEELHIALALSASESPVPASDPLPAPPANNPSKEFPLTVQAELVRPVPVQAHVSREVAVVEAVGADAERTRLSAFVCQCCSWLTGRRQNHGRGERQPELETVLHAAPARGGGLRESFMGSVTFSPTVGAEHGAE